jgi:hypothetical protein
MSNKVHKAKLIFLVAIGLMVSSFKPSPSANENGYLFKILRSRDSNEIWYAANLQIDGTINHDTPIQVFWVKKAPEGKAEPLTWGQNRYAYGVELLTKAQNNKGATMFRFVSYAGRTFEIRQMPDRKYKVFTKSNNKEIEVNQIFVQIDGGSFWLPSVPFVKLSGVETATGKLTTEIIYP